MLSSTLTVNSTTRSVTDTFAGYNHRMKIGDGEFYNTENLSTRDYPMLSTRKLRGTVKQLNNPQGMMLKDKLAYVDGGVLYYGGKALPITGLSSGEKQLVSMGGNICVFPDKVYYNTEKTDDYGSMEAKYSWTGEIEYQICNLTGDPYTGYTKSETAPEDPENGDLWYDTDNKSLKRYSAYQEAWVSIATVYTKLIFGTKNSIPVTFSESDGVTVSGSYYPDELDGTKLIYGLGGSETESDYIILVGLIDEPTTQSGTITISRTVPDMDFIVECQNRLWGCKYGYTEEYGNLNEIYCCALGDFKNWSKYQGISTDSWTASVGSDGAWTGAINYLGYPIFMKENRIHTVTVSATGAHSIAETVCRGCQSGCGKSMVVVNETLFYKSRTDVCIYQGSFPEGISSALGDVNYSDAVAGSYGENYYISMKNDAGEWNLFVYDSNNGLWIREDDFHAMAICNAGDELYAIDADNKTLLALNGTEGTLEDGISWMAESGILYYEYPDKKYVSRFDLRISAEEGAKIEVYVQYDSGELWKYHGRMYFKGTNSINFPVRPKRCDHMKIRIMGEGQAKIFSLARILEVGSDR